SGGRFRICFTEIVLTRHRQYLVSREGRLPVFVSEPERVHAEIRESGVTFRVGLWCCQKRFGDGMGRQEFVERGGLRRVRLACAERHEKLAKFGPLCGGKNGEGESDDVGFGTVRQLEFYCDSARAGQAVIVGNRWDAGKIGKSNGNRYGCAVLQMRSGRQPCSRRRRGKGSGQNRTFGVDSTGAFVNSENAIKCVYGGFRGAFFSRGACGNQTQRDSGRKQHGNGNFLHIRSSHTFDLKQGARPPVTRATCCSRSRRCAFGSAISRARTARRYALPR